MSFQRVEVQVPLVTIKQICDECEGLEVKAMYTLTPEMELDTRQSLHFCSSLCLKKHIIRWAELLLDGNGVRAMFKDVI